MISSQTVIKEKIELHLKKKSKTESGNRVTSNILTYTLTWPNSTREASLDYTAACGDSGSSGWQSGGSITITINEAKPGLYTFRYSVNAPVGEDASADYLLTLNGATEKSGHSDNARWNGTVFAEFVYYGTPYYSSISVNVFDDAICPSDSTGLSVGGVNDCESSLFWYPSNDMITLSITEGNEYASFTDLRTNERGLQTVQLYLSELTDTTTGLPNIYLRPKENNIGTPIVIRAEANGITQEKEVSVHLNEYSLTVSVNDTVFTQEETNILVFTNYSGICDAVPLSDDVTFDVAVTEGSQYGYLENPVTGESGISLVNLPHQDGGLQLTYHADGEEPSDNGGNVTINVVASDPEIPPKETAFIVMPQPLIVKFGNDKLSPGDTTEIFLYMRGPEGSEDPFPNGEYQEFTLKLIEGYQYADIIVPNDTTGYDTLENKTEPFKLTANGEIDLDSVRIKLYVETMIEDFGFPASPAKKKNPEQLKALNLESKGVNKKKEDAIIDEKEKQKKKGKTKGGRNDIAGTGIPGFGYTIWGTAEIDVISECEKDIVECENNEPQTVDESIIEVIGANYDWQWIDNQGNLQTVNTGTYCDIIGEDKLGVTTIAVNFPMGSEIGYQRFEDIKPEVCLDSSDPNNAKWQFHLNDIRVPIFTSVCDREGWIDLGDGTDENVLSQYIRDCFDLSDVIQWLDVYWYPGPYNPNKLVPITDSKYRFDPGISKHEEYHVNSLKKISIEIINNILESIRDSSNYSQEDYPCPEDIKNSEGNNMINNFQDKFQDKIIKWKSENTQEETRADENARPVYEVIKQNIRNWAEGQSWYNPDDPFCNNIFED